MKFTLPWLKEHLETDAPLPEIVDKLNKAAVAALKSPTVLAVLEKQGMNATPMTPQKFAQYVSAERRKWSDVVHVAGIEQR